MEALCCSLIFASLVEFLDVSILPIHGSSYRVGKKSYLELSTLNWKRLNDLKFSHILAISLSLPLLACDSHWPTEELPEILILTHILLLLILNHITPRLLKYLLKIFQELSSSLKHSGSGIIWPEMSHFPGNGWCHPVICQLHCTAHHPGLHSSLLIYSPHPPTSPQKTQEVTTVWTKFCHLQYFAEAIKMYPCWWSLFSLEQRKSENWPPLGLWKGCGHPNLFDQFIQEVCAKKGFAKVQLTSENPVVRKARQWEQISDSRKWGHNSLSQKVMLFLE